MLASPRSRKGSYAIRYGTIAFSLAVLFWKTQGGGGSFQNMLVVYMILLAVLMILAERATIFSLAVASPRGKAHALSAMDLFLIYLVSLLVMFARSLAGLPIPNAVMLCAIAIGFCSGLYGIVSTYRGRALH